MHLKLCYTFIIIFNRYAIFIEKLLEKLNIDFIYCNLNILLSIIFTVLLYKSK